jgi:biotin transport system substrate-specific component
VLGMKKGTIAVLLYLLIGLAGVPVFSGFTAGPAKLFGPTGGYLIGFILMALISGYFIDKFPGNMRSSSPVCFSASSHYMHSVLSGLHILRE